MTQSLSITNNTASSIKLKVADNDGAFNDIIADYKYKLEITGPNNSYSPHIFFSPSLNFIDNVNSDNVIACYISIYDSYKTPVFFLSVQDILNYATVKNIDIANVSHHDIVFEYLLSNLYLMNDNTGINLLPTFSFNGDKITVNNVSIDTTTHYYSSVDKSSYSQCGHCYKYDSDNKVYPLKSDASHCLTYLFPMYRKSI